MSSPAGNINKQIAQGGGGNVIAKVSAYRVLKKAHPYIQNESHICIN